MLNSCHTGRRSEDADLGIAIVVSVEGKSVEFSFDVMSDDCNLGDSSVERFCGGGVDDIAKTEDIVVFLMLEGVWVYVKVSGRVSES